MAAKKATQKPKLPKKYPEVKTLSQSGFRDSEGTRAELDLFLHKRNEIHAAMLGHPWELRAMVATLANNQVEVWLSLIEKMKQLEDPSVAHAVTVKQELDSLKESVKQLTKDSEKLSRDVEDVTSDLRSHERNFEHDYNRAPY